MKTTLIDEYNVLASFANKMLSYESQIDSEIQNIVTEHFWDMIENEELKNICQPLMHIVNTNKYNGQMELTDNMMQMIKY